MARETFLSTSKVNCGNPLNPATEGSYCFWFFNGGQSSNDRTIFSNWNGSTSGIFLRIDNNETLELFIEMGGSLRSLSPTTAMNQNAWSFVVVDFVEGTSTVLRIFVNDMSSPIGTESGNFGNYDAATNNFILMNLNTGSTVTPTGALAHFSVYDVRLSEQGRLMAKAGLNARYDKCLAFYPLYGNSSPEPDISGNGHNGTLTSTVKRDHAPVGRYVSAPGYRPQIVISPAVVRPVFSKIFQGQI